MYVRFLLLNVYHHLGSRLDAAKLRREDPGLSSDKTLV
jgi:hypothetical protein